MHCKCVGWLVLCFGVYLCPLRYRIVCGIVLYCSILYFHHSFFNGLRRVPWKAIVWVGPLKGQHCWCWLSLTYPGRHASYKYTIYVCMCVYVLYRTTSVKRNRQSFHLCNAKKVAQIHSSTKCHQYPRYLLVHSQQAHLYETRQGSRNYRETHFILKRNNILNHN